MSISILPIDESLTIRDLVRVTLEGAGMAVTLAEDGVEGVEAFRGGWFDAVVTAINMPRLDGFGIIEAIRAGDRTAASPSSC